MSGISFAQFSKIAPYIIRSRKAIMGHGKHGIGKSELVYQLAPQAVHILDLTDKYGDDYVFPIVERRASQMADVGDVIGVPEPEDSAWGRVTKFAPMEWFAQACAQPCILFFDEIDSMCAHRTSNVGNGGAAAAERQRHSRSACGKPVRLGRSPGQPLSHDAPKH